MRKLVADKREGNWFEEALNNPQDSRELNLIRADGEIRRCRVLLAPLSDSDTQFCYCAFQDQEDTHKLRDALQVCEAAFSTLSEGTFEGVVLINEGRIIEANRQMAAIFGYEHSELLGMKVVELIDPRDRGIVRTNIEREFEQPYEVRGIRKDGSNIYIEAHGQIITVRNRKLRLSSVRDLTSRKQAESALKESELRYRTVFGSSPDAILLMKGERFVDCNQQAADIFGCSRKEVLARTPIDFSPEFQPDGTRSEQAARRWIRIADKGSLLSFEWLHQRKSGEIFEAEVRLKQVEISRDPHLVAFVRDIGARKKYERDRELLAKEIENSRNRLKRLSTELVESQELERRRIARELHDDLGQLLTAMKINEQQIQRESNITAKAPVGRRHAEQLELINLTLERVRSLALDLRPSILDDLGLVPAVRWYLDRHVAIGGLYGILVCEKSEFAVSSSVGTACFRVLQEAISNILKHAQASNIRVSLSEVDDKLQMTVTDDGIGFNVEQARRESLLGQSFGLLGMQERIELLGGQLRIESSLGVGATITSLLPMSLNHTDRH